MNTHHGGRLSRFSRRLFGEKEKVLPHWCRIPIAHTQRGLGL
ncbi:unnamed protein product [Brassica oleracea]